MENTCRYLAGQNNFYREYVSTLQTELLESQGKFPAPPQGLNLNPQAAHIPGPEAPQHPDHAPQQQQQPVSAASEPLAAIAQAVMTPPAPMGDRQQHQQGQQQHQGQHQQQHQEGGREEGQDGQDEMDRSVGMQVDSLP